MKTYFQSSISPLTRWMPLVLSSLFLVFVSTIAAHSHAPVFPPEGLYISVKHELFGAVGDGKTCDGPAIQEAIEFAKNIGLEGNNKAEGITVFLPPGEYVIGQPLKIYGGTSGRTHLMGAGSLSTTITLAANATVDMIQLEPVFSEKAKGHNHSVISNLRLFGNKPDADHPDDDNQERNSTMCEQSDVMENVVGIRAKRAFSGFVLRNLKIDDINGTGIQLVLASNPSIENIGIARASEYGLWIQGGNQDSLNISNLEVADAGKAGVYIQHMTPHWSNYLFLNFRAEAVKVA